MKKWVSLVWVTLFVLSLNAVMFVETGSAASPSNTSATIQFKQGTVEFAIEGNSMDIMFGEQTLPVGAFTYKNISANTLSIADARQPAGDWEIKVKRTGDFITDNSKSFAGQLMLVAGTAGHSGGVSVSTSGVKVSSNVTVGNSSELVVTADAGQTTGTFLIRWAEDGGITLDLTAAEAATLVIGKEYEETLTWTLETIEP